MTAPLRRAHVRIWFALAAVLGALIAAALTARKENLPLNDIRWEDSR